jgi:hypothetical protein
MTVAPGENRDLMAPRREPFRNRAADEKGSPITSTRIRGS